MHDTLPQNDRGADCAAIRLVIDDVAAHEADAVTVARVDAHAARCPSCRFALAAARAYRRAMRRVGASERAPQGLRERALGLLHETRDPRGPRP
jgi:anti-sigma factor (TIGR02949 family)